ncbi:hypothetical protein KGF56_003153 [Candida oxycetoniae]|uniref:25S rRNA (Uridine(2843)-N(3))-methyltransferase n=1 Tax=Candida oxycetoniae TaxID=497107 RepID=A0AAI9SWE4_9ASCO|nr:uncharacterized protein KGF56_003153 [Candida oxycetoniae]KAI3403994.2 hypothetical protein KGF56_003153 [Candida oxycetoniae]
MHTRKVQHATIAVSSESRIKEEEEDDVNLGPLVPFSTDKSMEPYQVIDLFNVCFRDILHSPDLQVGIQSVKTALYHRDYLAAFDDENKRFTYAARWTPSRSLAYAALFSSLNPISTLLDNQDLAVNVLCIGGGASSELVGLGSVFCRLKEYKPTSPSKIRISIVDIADWNEVVSNVASYIKRNWLFQEEKLVTQFTHADILSVDLNTLEIGKMDLVTLMFTTNELFSEKRKDTIKLFSNLSKQCKPGSLLLIAESAGSFSHITIGEKKFPVQFLIDTILVGKMNENNGSWELISQNDGIWYRVNEKEVNYSIKLENMRFFYRLYRRKQ